MNRDFRGGSSVPADDEAAALMRAIVERVSYARGVPTRGHANRELAEWVAQISTKGEVELRKIHCDEIKARRERERLEWLAQISARAEAELRQIRSAEAQQRRKREQLQWLAQISDGHERELRALVAEETGPTARDHYAQFAEGLPAQEALDASKHPRLGGPPNPGWWATRGGSSSASASHTMRAPTRSIPYRPGQSGARGVTVSGTPSATWPAHAPSVPALPRVGSGAGAAAGVAAGGLLGGLRNASMSPYSARVPAARAMLDIWVYDLEKRVRAGQLSHDDAVGIFNIAVLGAKAQGFTPAGGTMSAVHNSAVDFLGKAEAVYFARKKKPGAGKSSAKTEKPAGAEPQPASAPPPETTPTTDPSKFRPVRGSAAKENIETGEIWEKDKFHGDHYEVYKSKKMQEKRLRDRSVWDDGRFKEKH